MTPRRCTCSHTMAHIAEVCIAGTFFGAAPAAAAPVGGPPLMQARTEAPAPAAVQAEAPWIDKVQPSAGALVAVVTQLTSDGTELSLGQAEASLGLAFGAFAVEGVLAWDEDKVALGALVGAVELVGNKDALWHGAYSLQISGGQMDVPIGLDFEEYAASDRPMVSEPLVLGHTHGAWNAYGAQVALSVGDLGAGVFGAQGFELEALDGAEPGTPGPAFGGWARMQLGLGFSMGASGAALFDRDVALSAGVAELDVSYEYEGFKARAEAIAMLTGAEGARQLATGGYLMAVQTLGRFELAARADLVDSGEALERRFAVSAGVQVIEEHLLVRTEVSSDFGPEKAEALLLQAVAAL